jgi:DNA-binding beta-propeller fold protein YncE
MRRRRTASAAAAFLVVLAACGSPAAPRPPAITQTAISGLPATPTIAADQSAATPTAAAGQASQAAPDRWIFPGVPAHPLMSQMLPIRVPDTRAGLGGKTLSGQVELRTVHIFRPDSLSVAEIRQFYRDRLPTLGWQPLADYPNGTLYHRPSADGANEIGLAVTLIAADERMAVFEALEFAARGAVEPTAVTHAAAGQWGPEDFEPQGIAASAAGEIYVAFKRSHTVQRLSADGTPIASWGAKGSGPGEFGGEYTGPSGVAVGPDGSVFVVDPGNGRIQKFAPDGAYLATIGAGQIEADDMFGATGIAVDAAGTIYLADRSQIRLFNSDGSARAAWPLHTQAGRDGTSAEWIAVDAAGAVYVSDHLNNLIQKYAADGSFVAEWGGPGVSPGLFDGPQGLAVAGESLYVVDGHHGRIQVFSLAGELRGLIGGADGDLPFYGGRGIVMAAGGEILVANQDASEIVRFVPAERPALASAHPAVSALPLPERGQMTMLPIRPSEQSWAALSTRWLRGEPCAAPCWEGITPGVTTVGEALDLLKRSPLIDPESVFVAELTSNAAPFVEHYLSWRWIGNDYAGGQATFSAVLPLPTPTPRPTPEPTPLTPEPFQFFDILSEERAIQPDAAMLAQIIVSISPDLSNYRANPSAFRLSRLGLFTLDDVIAVYGEPSHVLAVYDRADSSRIKLVFEKYGIVLAASERGPISLSGRLPIDQIAFSIDPRRIALISDPAEYLQPWQGMRDFAFYCKPGDGGEPCP